MSVRDRFKIGDRVRMTAAGLRMPRQARVPTTGRVVGFGRSPVAVRILRDGRSTVVGAYADWWEVDASAAPEPGLLAFAPLILRPTGNDDAAAP